VLFHDGKWKVADLGIARFIEEATSSNTLKDCLSPFYAAPEQWRFERATHATDVYALGCIGYCLLTAHPPFRINPAEEHQKSPVPLFACEDPRLSTLINMMLRKLPQTRPVLSRVGQLLEEIVTRPQEANAPDAMSVLAKVAADVADKEQKRQAREQAESTAYEARVALARGAFEILTENLERLWGRIHMQAANAQRTSNRYNHKLEFRLGDGYLEIDLSRPDAFAAGLFKHSGWDVVASSQISVSQAQRRYVWSASLWYMRFNSESDYRWYEVSYWSLGGVESAPFACTDVEDADYAASRIMHSVNIAFGPEPIDDEKEAVFHDRWTWLLAKAAGNQLTRPSSMPIRSWPPQP